MAYGGHIQERTTMEGLLSSRTKDHDRIPQFESPELLGHGRRIYETIFKGHAWIFDAARQLIPLISEPFDDESMLKSTSAGVAPNFA